MDDLHNRWPHRWITQKATPARSRIHGLGMIATKKIARGQTVAVYGGVIVPKSQIHEYRQRIGGIRGIQIDADFFICPTEEKGGRFNHSCSPNLGFASALKVIALSAIDPGQELVLDYAFSESAFEAFRCSCRSSGCRRVITSSDWKHVCSDDQWANSCSPYLREKHAKLRATSS